LLIAGLAIVLAGTGDSSVPGAGSVLRPVVETETGGGETRIWVVGRGPDGTTQRHLLRETRSAVMVGPSGGGPEGRTAFATWTEDGTRWFSYTRDGGVAWAESRALKTELRLRDGSIQPGSPMPTAKHGLVLPETGRLHLVQFRTAGLEEWRDSLAALGAEVLSHVPHNAHVVRAEAAAIAGIRSLDFVERVEPYHPSYRLQPSLRDEMGHGAGAFGLKRVRVVTFEWGPEAKQRVIETAEALGAEVAVYWPSGHVLELWVDEEQLGAIAAHDDVQWIDRWTPPGTDMDLVRQDAGTDWVEDRFGYCGQGVRGEVMDLGIQEDHPDFDGVLLHGPHDVASHGTSTYGIVFGNGDRDGDGDAQGTGHMPCGEAQGIFADNGEFTDRFAHTQELKQAPYFASFQTNSWGAHQIENYTSVSQEMDDIIWRLDIAITQSQSNMGTQDSRPEAWAKNVISVGGVRHYGTLDTSDDAWASGASIGPAADGRIKPDLSYWYDSIYTTTTGSGYTTGFGGTSAATPEVAGVLGLMVQMWADNVWGTDPQGGTVFEKQPHFSTLKALLVNNSRQYDFVGTEHDLTRVHQGWGRPSARVAYERAARSLVVDEQETLSMGQSVTYTVDVGPTESELKVTMVYPDPPGTTSASLHRINDVNLKVISPTGTVYHGNNGLLDGTESTPGGSPNDLDTVENVFVRNPETGTWEIEITALEVNQDGHLATPGDDVTFALVVTGGIGAYASGAGQASLDRPVVACGDDLTMIVRDGNAGSSTLTATVRSETEAVPETVVLYETSPGSGNYTGAIATTNGSQASGDGLLSISHGDTVTLEYVDADDGSGGSNVSRQDTVTTDCQAPLISGIAVSDVSVDSATIVWSTDEPATSETTWGVTNPPGQSTAPVGVGTSHSIQLTGLQECTVHYFSVGGEDDLGNASVSDNAGNYYHFETWGDFGDGPQPCHEGRIVIETDPAACQPASVPVRLTDIDLNADTGTAEQVTVWVTSSTEAIPEVLVLTETGPDTSTFAGTIPTAPGPAVAADGVVQTAAGDLLTARYDDADDGTGSAKVSTDTTNVDCTSPLFESVTVLDVTDRSATVAWTTTEVTTGHVEWGTTPALGTQLTSYTPATVHSVGLSGFAECGRVYFRVVATDEQGNTAVADSGGAPFEFNGFTTPGLYHEDDFETDTGWTLEGEWEIGEPQGLGTAPGDPTTAYSGTQVLGHDLSGQGNWPGDYEIGADDIATSPVIDASGWTDTRISFQAWINEAQEGIARFEARDAAGTWWPVYTSNYTGVTQSSWGSHEYDVSQYADGNPVFQVRFRQMFRVTLYHDAGWNVDLLTFRDGSLPEFAACGGCTGAPTFAGLISVIDDDPCADSGLTLAWNVAPSWGTGNTGTYAIYRDTVPGFTPGPGNLVASGIAGTTWTDPSPPADVEVHYIVRAENDETCGTGPANGGVTDGNLLSGSATNATSQTPPGDVGATLYADPVNRAHVRLEWSAATGAQVYRIYRADSAVGVFQLVGSTDALTWEDPDALTSTIDFYYDVRAVDACGNEGP
jgi:hypothetical protein